MTRIAIPGDYSFNGECFQENISVILLKLSSNDQEISREFAEIKMIPTSSMPNHFLRHSSWFFEKLGAVIQRWTTNNSIWDNYGISRKTAEHVSGMTLNSQENSFVHISKQIILMISWIHRSNRCRTRRKTSGWRYMSMQAYRSTGHPTV